MVANLIVLDMKDFNVILGMYWLATYYTLVDCHKKIVNFHISNQPKFSFMESKGIAPPQVVSALQASRMLKKGCI